MAEPESASDEFVEQSYLTYVVPARTNIDLSTAFGDLQPEGSILDSIPQRDSLYFGKYIFLAHLCSHHLHS